MYPSDRLEDSLSRSPSWLNRIGQSELWRAPSDQQTTSALLSL